MDWSSLAVPAGAVGAALLALALMASAVIVWSLKPLTRWRLRRLPGPRPDWLFGNLLQIKELGLHEQRVRWQREYGKVFVWWQASKPIVIVADPDGARKILLKQHDKEGQTNPLQNNTFGRISRQLLPIVGWPEAKSLRAAWQPVFHSSSLADYAGPMREGARRLLARLDQAEKLDKEVNIWRLLGDMTMDVVGTTAFGVDLNTQSDTDTSGSSDDPTQSFTAAAQAIFSTGGPSSSAKNPVLLLAMAFPVLAPLLRRLVSAMQLFGCWPEKFQVLETANMTLTTKALALAKAAMNGTTGKDMPKVGSFLRRLAAVTTLDENKVAAQAFTFMLAGYETTANTLGFALYNLSSSPEVG
mmetsp:Transcript_13353/g.37834  ORF Transcript_13353/g.37834 Transcript_13353/m.37834 type:complete len:357 (-) Transcript_13353:1259-2329(-)